MFLLAAELFKLFVQFLLIGATSLPPNHLFATFRLLSSSAELKEKPILWFIGTGSSISTTRVLLVSCLVLVSLLYFASPSPPTSSPPNTRLPHSESGAGEAGCAFPPHSLSSLSQGLLGLAGEGRGLFSLSEGRGETALWSRR